jgi:hypothetical protein
MHCNGLREPIDDDGALADANKAEAAMTKLELASQS